MIFAGDQHRHLTKRVPRGRGFAWGRFPSVDHLGNCVGVQYRLFRRDHRGITHMEPITFYRACDRATIAQQVRQACHRLRNKVDEIDLREKYGIAA